MRGTRAFAQAATASAKAIGSIGTESEKTGDKAKAGWKSVAKWAGGTAAIYSAGRFLRSAVSTTEDLAKSTMTLQRATGLDAKTASSWAEVTKVRGINTRQFQVGLTKLSKTMEAARGGNAKALATLQNYGVSQDQIQAGDVGGTIGRVADAFASMHNPAEKATLAQTLFGKAGQSLAPILSGGSKGINEQLAMVQRYGATISDTQGAKDMIASQREMRIAMDGLKIQLGTKLLPAIRAFLAVMLKVVRVLSPVLRNTTVLSVALGVLAVAFVAAKVQAIATAVAFVKSNLVLLAIVVAVALIVAGAATVVARWRWFGDLVAGAWDWIRTHWQLFAVVLLGPVGVGIVLLVRNWSKIRTAVASAFGTITTTFDRIARVMPAAFTVDLSGMGVADWLNVRTLFGNRIKVGVVDFTLPALAAGGTVRVGGPALVGEAGPELVTVAEVRPVIEASRARAMLARRVGQPPTIINPVHLTRRQLHDATGDHVADQQARR